MKKKLLELIQGEKKYNPYTDDQLGKIVQLRRDEVTVLRGKYNIPDSRERRKSYLSQDMKQILHSNNKITDIQLTKILNEKGYVVSRHTIANLRKAELDNVKSRQTTIDKDDIGKPKESRSKKELTVDPFRKIIGYNGSLRTQVQQAKAAILYPPIGLHTLIVGPTGTGKTKLAEVMYDYAIASEIMSVDSPFVVFNCADYAENPHLLLSMLFGHVKGAFTGADNDKEGLVEKANHGILFLDEVHRLPPEGQELLYLLIDKGMYRKLGESETFHKANIMLIAATTENIESSLLLTFRRRIPMVIEISSLSDRSYNERYELLQLFFHSEANRIKEKIVIDKKVIEKFLYYDCPGNIGQLRSDIQVACAKAFLIYMGNTSSNVKIDLACLPMYITKQNLQKHGYDQYSHILEDMHVYPGDEPRGVVNQNDLYVIPQNIYEFIENKYKDLSKKGLEEKDINRLITEQIENQFQQYIRHFGENPILMKRDTLTNVAGEAVVKLVDEMLSAVQLEIGEVDDQLFACLVIHFSTAIDRIKQNKPINNIRLKDIKENYPFEYAVAKKMVNIMEKSIQLSIPEDEIGFVAMYLHAATVPENNQINSVGIIVISHGRVAKGMAEVANKLLGVNHALGIEMDLEDSPASMLKKVIEGVRLVDGGKGVLLLGDMGSLLTFDNEIMCETGIKVKTVGNTNTMMVLEALRKALLPDSDLNALYSDIVNHSYRSNFTNNFKKTNDKIIITICLTGSGTALKLKRIIEDNIFDNNTLIKVVPLGVIDKKSITIKIQELQKKAKVIAIVGAINPNYPGIPFYSIENILNDKGIEKMKEEVLMKQGTTDISQRNENSIKVVLDSDLIMLNKDYKNKNDVIDALGKELLVKNFINTNFLLDVYRREVMAPTTIENSVAIPHGEPMNVKKASIAIAILKDPICWEPEKMVRIVFLLALKENSLHMVSQLYKVIRDKNFISKLYKYKDSADVKRAILSFLDSNTK